MNPAAARKDLRVMFIVPICDAAAARAVRPAGFAMIRKVVGVPEDAGLPAESIGSSER
jgi:hypothetical protein